MLLHLNLTRFLFSSCVQVEIMELSLSGVHVNVEKTVTTSNVNDMAHFFNYGEGQELLPASGREYTLHKVTISGIRATTTFSTGSKIWEERKKVAATTTPIGDIYYPDFNKKFGIKRGLAKAILQGIFKKVEEKIQDTTSSTSCCGP